MTDTTKIFDGLLVLQYRAGNKKALNLLVKRYHLKLCRQSYWYTHDIEAAKDIVQDSWAVIMTKLETLKDPNFFGSWALSIVTRRSLDYVNKVKRATVQLEEFQRNASFEDSSHSKEGDEMVTKKLIGAISALPKEQQMVLRLFYTQEYSLREISKILGISEGTVKSRLFHAREKLKSILK